MPAPASVLLISLTLMRVLAHSHTSLPLCSSPSVVSIVSVTTRCVRIFMTSVEDM